MEHHANQSTQTPNWFVRLWATIVARKLGLGDHFHLVKFDKDYTLPENVYSLPKIVQYKNNHVTYYPDAGTSWKDNSTFSRTHGDAEDQVYLDEHVQFFHIEENHPIGPINYDTFIKTLRKDTTWKQSGIKKHQSGMVYFKQPFHYGIFETTIWLPDDDALWPAIWLYGGLGREIDIIERFCNKRLLEGKDGWQIQTNVHSETINGKRVEKNQQLPRVTHVFDKKVRLRLDWTPTVIKFYVNKSLQRTIHRIYDLFGTGQSTKLKAGKWYIVNDVYVTEPMWLIQNVAVRNGCVMQRHHDSTKFGPVYYRSYMGDKTFKP